MALSFLRTLTLSVVAFGLAACAVSVPSKDVQNTITQTHNVYFQVDCDKPEGCHSLEVRVRIESGADVPQGLHFYAVDGDGTTLYLLTPLLATKNGTQTITINATPFNYTQGDVLIPGETVFVQKEGVASTSGTMKFLVTLAGGSPADAKIVLESVTALSNKMVCMYQTGGVKCRLED